MRPEARTDKLGHRSRVVLDVTAKKAVWNSNRPPRFPKANLNIYSWKLATRVTERCDNPPGTKEERV